MREKIKVTFMGTPEFAIPPLMSLINDEDFDVQMVITQEDKKVGRKRVITPPPVKNLALKYNIPVLQPPSLKNNNEITELLEGLDPDFIVAVAYGQILPENILNIPNFSCVNIHGSLLPNYRGASPIEEALLKGDKETGVSFIKMERKLDSGPVYLMQRIEIKDSDNSRTLRDKLSGLAGTLLPEVLKDIYDGVISPIPQETESVSFCHKISKEDGKINLNEESAEEIKNKLRAYTPWPGCYLNLEGKKLKLLEIDIDKNFASAKSNEIVELDSGKIGIGTKKGIIIPLNVQLEGKNPMSIHDFLRGNKSLLTRLLDSAR